MTATAQNIALLTASFIRGHVKTLQATTMPDPAAKNASAERRNALDGLVELAKSLDAYSPAFEQGIEPATTPTDARSAEG